jgi:hypothetical protein
MVFAELTRSKGVYPPVALTAGFDDEFLQLGFLVFDSKAGFYFLLYKWIGLRAFLRSGRPTIDLFQSIYWIP